VIAAAPALGRRVRVAGAGRSAAYGEDDGFMVVFTRERPALPNGVQVASLPAVGTELVIRAAEVWDPTLRLADSVRGVEVVGAEPDLVRAVETRDPTLAARAGARLIGRGGDLRRRTTALSATLLELAASGMGPEPLQAWLAGDAAARARLETIGHSTGRAIARGAAIALSCASR
jgi:hypothetical protein